MLSGLESVFFFPYTYFYPVPTLYEWVFAEMVADGSIKTGMRITYGIYMKNVNKYLELLLYYTAAEDIIKKLTSKERMQGEMHESSKTKI